MRDTSAHVVLFVSMILGAVLAATGVLAHPGSGITVNSQGQVYFVHTGVGVFKVDREDRRPVRYAEPGFHFLTIDPEGRFPLVPRLLPGNALTRGSASYLTAAA